LDNVGEGGTSKKRKSFEKEPFKKPLHGMMVSKWCC